jgi:hypothetical protein
MVATSKARFTSDDTDKMGTLSGKLPPTHVIAWRLSVTVDKDGEIDVSYSEAWEFDIAGDETIKTHLEKYARAPDTKYGKKPNERYPNKTKSNLSIRHKDYSYMLFVVGNKNLQFNEGGEPFEVERNNSSFYLDPLCAWIANGQINFDREAGPGCRVACFIADSVEDQKASTEEFYTSFNIYLDLMLKRTDNPAQTRPLPIIIDPDVGHPGGTEPPMP